MHLDGYMIIGSAVVGLLVGMTGAGGGALMTPMLIFMFGVSPAAAISSDLVAAVVMRPVGAAVHLSRKTVNLGMVRWLALGSVPGALLGSYLLHVIGDSTASIKLIERILGAALLLGAAAMALRAWLRHRSGQQVRTVVALRPLPTVAVGLFGGIMVGLTSVGSGSLMIVLLLFVYPALASSQLVGTDLVQAIPLTAAAAVGQLIFGQVVFGVTVSVILGSVPAVLVGSLLSSRAPDRYLRPVVTLVIIVSGLKYAGSPNVVLGVVGIAGLVAAVTWLVVDVRKARRARAASDLPSAGAGAVGLSAVGDV